MTQGSAQPVGQTYQPVISIITVVFNGAETLESAVTSVLSQSYPHIQYIIIDGGSTDGTLQIIQKYAPGISCWISESDGGIYDAMNKGLKQAGGDFVLFLGADDELTSPEIISRAVSLFTDPAHIYYGDVFFIHDKVVTPGRAMDSHQLAVRNFSHQGLFYPRHVFEKYSYNLKYKLFADYAYNLKLFKDHRNQFRYIGLVITDFNDKGASFSSGDARFEEDRLALIEECLGKRYRIYMGLRIPIGHLKRAVRKILQGQQKLAG